MSQGWTLIPVVFICTGKLLATIELLLALTIRIVSIHLRTYEIPFMITGYLPCDICRIKASRFWLDDPPSVIAL